MCLLVVEAYASNILFTAPNHLLFFFSAPFRREVRGYARSANQKKRSHKYDKEESIAVLPVTCSTRTLPGYDFPDAPSVVSQRSNPISNGACLF